MVADRGQRTRVAAVPAHAARSAPRNSSTLTQSPFVGYTLQQHLWSSFGRFAMGFGLAVAIGVPLGLLMGWFRWLDAIVTPLFDALRFVAPIAWVPFAALWFGTGIGGPVLIIFSGAFPPCVINAYRGAKYVETALHRGRANARRQQLANDHRGAAAGIGAVDRRGAADQCGPRLAIAGRRRADRRVERDRLPAGQRPGEHHTSIVMSGMIAIGIVGFAIDALLRMLERRINARRGR